MKNSIWLVRSLSLPIGALLFLCFFFSICAEGQENDPARIVSEPAPDFPRYEIAGFEAESDAMRHLHWRHYQRPDFISPHISRQGA
ncbi:MAG: hypothetical protein FWD31_13335, partial [Planctomycetaceae bacterium]|nr:hypothetical protein [Planctomycetaceae bacterium]